MASLPLGCARSRHPRYSRKFPRPTRGPHALPREGHLGGRKFRVPGHVQGILSGTRHPPHRPVPVIRDNEICRSRQRLMHPCVLGRAASHQHRRLASHQTSHSSASSAFSLLVYLAGIDGDFQRPWVCTACNGAPRRVILIASPTRPE